MRAPREQQRRQWRSFANASQAIPTTAKLWGVPPAGQTTLGTATGVAGQTGP